MNTIYTHAIAAAVAGALAFGGAWQVQGWRYGKQIADIHATHTQAALKRSEAARADETKTALKESTHAADTSKNSDEFTTSQPVRDAIARADVARADRLRLDAERRAGTYRAMAEAGAAACSDLADRHAALDRHIVDGTRVVADLGAALDRRDAEVVLLRRQIDVDRALFADSNPSRQAAGAKRRSAAMTS